MSSYVDAINKKNEANIQYNSRFTAEHTTKMSTKTNVLFTNNQYLKFNETLVFKFRQPVNKFIYNQYNILEYKIDAINTLSLKNNLLEKSIDASQIDNIHYAIDYVDNTICYYNNNEDNNKVKIYNITVTLNGKNTKTIILNDSTAYYYSNLRNFSISYNNNQVQDILATSIGIPSEILLQKKRNCIFLFILICKNQTTSLEFNTLLNLIAK
ncbi:MAG: hypothetical protein ABI166_01070 [Mucilaginibacter sp.]